jgi:transcriptional antiterminator RfaH
MYIDATFIASTETLHLKAIIMTEALWYALRVRTRSEWMVEGNLEHKGYETFCPMYKLRRQWANRIRTADRPLFPGYLFCRFDIRMRLPILTTPGVSLIVGPGKCPEPIPENEIEAIRTLVKSGASYEPCAYLTAGQLVEIQHGSLSGLVGLVTEVRSEFRLIMSVDLLMRSVSVEIDRTWVKPIADRRERSLAASPATPLRSQVPLKLGV